MFKILSDKQINLTDSLLNEILLPYNITRYGYTIPDSGISNTNVIVTTETDKFFVRILRQGKKSKEDLETESNLIDYLYKNDIPVPKIIANNQSQKVSSIMLDNVEWLYQVFSFMEGEHPEFKMFSNDLIFLQNVAFEHAKMLKTMIEFSKENTRDPITNISQSSSARIIENMLEDIDLQIIKNTKILEFIESRKSLYIDLDVTKLQNSWIHDDVNVSNILVEGNKIKGILDFDESYFGPLASCVANTAFEFIRFRNSPEIIHTYLFYFEQILPLTKEDKTVIKHFILLRNIMFIVYLLKFHGEDFKFIDVHFNLANTINLL